MKMTERVIAGAVAGAVGTGAMTLFMRPGVARFLSSRWRPDQFVPREVVQWGAQVAGRPRALTARQEGVVAAGAHLAYGMAMGALYGIIGGGAGGARSPAPRGAAWGLAVWAAGYEGWMPAAGVRPATTEQPPTKWPLPIGNHVVFGVVTAAVFDRIQERRRRSRGLGRSRWRS
jgi:hypothetical protein